MTIAEWLETRTPRAPGPLADRLRAALGDRLAADAAEAPRVMLATAEERLGRWAAADGGSCGDALELLAIDALVTYAFEAAADGPAADLDMLARETVSRMAALPGRATGAGAGGASP